MKLSRLGLIAVAVGFVLSFFLIPAAMPAAYAQCVDGDAGDNVIECADGDPDNWFGKGGNDTMTNAEGSVIGNTISGQDGNDVITNNGEIVNNLLGVDGNDRLINNGTVGRSVSGGTGNDEIIINGTVGFRVRGLEGDDIITLTENAVVGDVIYGDDDTDTLIFNMHFESTADGYAELEARVNAWAQQLAAANPAGGSITINGNLYTWTSFEQLVSLLRASLVQNSDGRLNPTDLHATAVPYCGSLGVIIYTPEGVPAIDIALVDVIAAAGGAENILVAEGLGISLYSLTSGEAQVVGPGDYNFKFDPAVCGL